MGGRQSVPASPDRHRSHASSASAPSTPVRSPAGAATAPTRNRSASSSDGSSSDNYGDADSSSSLHNAATITELVRRMMALQAAQGIDSPARNQLTALEGFLTALAGRQHELQIAQRAPQKCPVCVCTFIDPAELQAHLSVCGLRAIEGYNEDILVRATGKECDICMEEMTAGDSVARLPCLCVYHTVCIEDWFKRSRTCPEHPG